VCATDSLGRLVAEGYQNVPSSGGRTGLTLTFADLIAPMVRVDVFVVDKTAPPFTEWDRQHAAHQSAQFYVRRTRDELGLSLVADGLPGSEHNVDTLLGILRQQGFDTVHAPATAASRKTLANVNLWALPEVTRYVCEAAVDGVVRVPCLTDKTFRAEEAVRVQEAAVLFWAGGSGMYSLGGGNCLVASEENVCQSPSCLAGFQETLKKQYASLAALNQTWGTSFADWGAVRPMDRGQTLPGQPAPWIDFRRYMDGVFAGAHLLAEGVVQGVDRYARAGFRAADEAGPYKGYDWGRLTSQLDVLAFDNDPLTVEKVRSYRTPRCFSGMVFDPEAFGSDRLARWLPFHAALHRIPALWWPQPLGSAMAPTRRAALTPDGRPTETLLRLAEGLRGVQATGLDALLMKADRKDARIAIYDSQATFYLDLSGEAPGEGMAESQRTFAWALEDLGFQYDFVAPEQALRDGLKAYGVLILPAARALSDGEVAAIAVYHAAGGHVIADIAPAGYDEHGTPHTQPALDVIFGARELGKGPGLAVLLGELAPYRRLGLEPSDVATRKRIGDLMDTMGVQPVLEMTAHGTDLFRGERFGFGFGKAEMLGILADAGDDTDKQKLNVTFENAGFVYDWNRGMRVTRPKKVKFSLEPGAFQCYSILPYEVTELRIDAPESVVAGRRLTLNLSIKTREGLPGEHLVHIEFAPATQEPVRHYAQNATCPAGHGDTFIPLALNERPGFYTITARDVLTGMTAETSVEVIGRGL
ncbi:MAG: hypothetical protein QG656_2430, partial [Candidatus Hydrogenedentes bacterium]|nr:hypothetical protein [Candidatus Hydrogenedentota bacterium]